jgi:DNA-binding NtrC family response regulator
MQQLIPPERSRLFALSAIDQSAGARVLVVENDFIILAELELLLSEAGAEVIVSQTVQDALAKTDKDISAAILDFALISGTVEPVAAHLVEYGVPFVFYTGHLGTDELLAKWPGSTIIQKPADAKTLVAAAASLLGR